MTVEEHRDPLSGEVKPREGAVGPHPPDIHLQTQRLLLTARDRLDKPGTVEPVDHLALPQGRACKG
jgi:hypothetical protein